MKDPIVILHGWGSMVSGEKRFHEVKAILEKNGFRVFTPDLPGFGENKLQRKALVFQDYLLFVKEYMRNKKIKKVILLGHSFGGRIAIAFTAKYPEFVSDLILVGASGIPQKLSLKKKIIQELSKRSKPFFTLPVLQTLYQPIRKILYKGIGEMDYYKAGNLAQTFKNVYRVSIVKDLEKITKPTLIVWGEKDTMTPLRDGLLMHQQIKKSRLVVVKDATHKLPYENPKEFTKIVLNFLKTV